MRIVIALGRYALPWRSESMNTEVQRRNLKIAADAVATGTIGTSVDARAEVR